MLFLNSLFRKSKWIHKYLGLLIVLFLCWMSLSGILLNHPNLISKYSLPKSFVPDSYIPNNWNAGTMRGVVRSEMSDSLIYVFGRQGVHVSYDDAKNFEPFMAGYFPRAPKERITNSLFLADSLFLAATDSGLFRFSFKDNLWIKLNIISSSKKFVKIIKAKDKIIAFTDSEAFASPLSGEFSFLPLTLNRNVESSYKRLVDLFFELHDGSFFGLFGKIVWDCAALVLIFLCLSALYIWYIPKRWKMAFVKNKRKSSTRERKIFSLLFLYHRRLGFYFAILLVLICFTGAFLRPPLIIALFGNKISSSSVFFDKNKMWHESINNALYDSYSERIVIDCKDGLWASKCGENLFFEALEISVPIFPMGASVFDEFKRGEWLIGSFAGLFKYKLMNTETIALMPIDSLASTGRPAATMITGCIVERDSSLFPIGHYKGLCDLNGNAFTSFIYMPDYIVEDFRMPLWNYLFEIHNARMFKPFVGSFYILIIPLFGLLSILVLLTGLVDFLFRKYKS